jgi:chemotaxis protein CheC
MGNLGFNSFDNMQLDVLKEIGNIGSGNATTALSEMIDKRIDMNVPVVRILEFKDLADVIGGAENPIVGILLGIEQDVNGMIMFVLEQSSAHNLVNMLMRREIDSFSDFDEMDFSALNEIGNIISGAYLRSIATLTNLTMTATVPNLAIDMAGAILSVPAIEFGKVGDSALMIQSEFGDDNNKVVGYFIFIPEEESYIKIMNSLGIEG